MRPYYLDQPGFEMLMQWQPIEPSLADLLMEINALTYAYSVYAFGHQRMSEVDGWSVYEPGYVAWLGRGI